MRIRGPGQPHAPREHQRVGLVERIRHRPAPSSHWCSWPPLIAAEPRPEGDATLVERETTLAVQANVKVWDLDTDDGRHFFSQTKSGLPAQVQEDNNQGAAYSHGKSPPRPTR